MSTEIWPSRMEMADAIEEDPRVVLEYAGVAFVRKLGAGEWLVKLPDGWHRDSEDFTRLVDEKGRVRALIKPDPQAEDLDNRVITVFLVK